MPFDWSEYKILADELRERDDEASKRSSISRLYYSFYHRGLQYLTETGRLIYSEQNQAHKQVWDKFLQIGGTHKSIGLYGKRLLENRVRADYKEISRVNDEVASAYKYCENLQTYLDQVERYR